MFRELSKYTGFISNSIKELTAYRFSTFIWSIMPLIFMLIQYFLWQAIFASGNGSLYGIPVSQYMAYLGIGFIVMRLTGCSREMSISSEFKNGNIAVALIKPYSYALMIFFRHVGEKIVFLIQILPVIAIVIALTGLRMASPGVLAAFLASIILAFFLNFLFSLFLGILAFKITNVWGLFLFRASLRNIFSGELIAIAFYFKIAAAGLVLANIPVPGASQEAVKSLFGALGILAYCLPFQAMFYIPTGIYTGLFQGSHAILLHLGIQAAWVAFFLLLTAFLWKRAMRDITVLGG